MGIDWGLGLLEHPAPNREPGDIVVLADGREALVTARFEAEGDARGAPRGRGFAELGEKLFLV